MRVVTQRGKFDCGVACICSLFHLDYADVFYAATQISSGGIRGGLTGKELIAVSAHFRRTLKRVNYRRVDLEDHDGILGITGHGWGHWVLLRPRTILEVDPAAYRVWDPADYLKYHHARIGDLLTEDDPL